MVAASRLIFCLVLDQDEKQNQLTYKIINN